MGSFREQKGRKTVWLKFSSTEYTLWGIWWNQNKAQLWRKSFTKIIWNNTYWRRLEVSFSFTLDVDSSVIWFLINLNYINNIRFFVIILTKNMVTRNFNNNSLNFLINSIHQNYKYQPTIHLDNLVTLFVIKNPFSEFLFILASKKCIDYL